MCIRDSLTFDLELGICSLKRNLKERPVCPMSVSYTHLDVYKRQVPVGLEWMS